MVTRRPSRRQNRGRKSTAGARVISPNQSPAVKLWVDASNPAAYAASAGTLTSVKNLITGTNLSTITGTPKAQNDPRSSRPAFWFDGASHVSGTDATASAVAAGTDLPFTAWVVCTPDDVTANYEYLSFGDGVNSGNAWELMQSAGVALMEKLGNPTGPARDWLLGQAQAGTHVLRWRTVDGLTVFQSTDTGTETSATLTTPGAITCTIIGIGVLRRNTATFPLLGHIHEIVLADGTLTAADRAGIDAYLANKWSKPPQVYFLGDSLTTGQTATNGGFHGLSAAYAASNGLRLAPQGPFTTGALYPSRHSGVSGDTCALMNTRVNSASQGLGATPYRNAKIIHVLAGTNANIDAPTTAADYTTLLASIRSKVAASNYPTARIIVSTLTDINGSTAYVDAYNALLPAIWNASDAANPSAPPLIRIDYHAVWGSWATGNGLGYYTDSTHYTNAGYVALFNGALGPALAAILPGMQ